MDHIELWIFEQSKTFEGDAAEAVRVVASRWHHDGQAVLAR